MSNNDSHVTRISTAVGDAGGLQLKCIWVVRIMHQSPSSLPLSETESQDIPPTPSPRNGIALLSRSIPSSITSAFFYYTPFLPSPPLPHIANSGAPPIGRQDFPFSAKMEEEVSRLKKGAQTV